MKTQIAWFVGLSLAAFILMSYARSLVYIAGVIAILGVSLWVLDKVGGSIVSKRSK